MDVYPCTFRPIYQPTIWGGRNLERLFGRTLPPDEAVGESWELADLPEGVSVVANGPRAGTTLTELTASWGGHLLGRARPQPGGRFPLLLKLLDATDVLSLQVHPDAAAAAAIGGGGAMKTECWYVVESRGGMIYKGLRPGVTAEQFRTAIETNTAEQVVQSVPVAAGDFHYLPAGTVHALGAGVVVAEIQTPSNTTYRVTDWGRGRELHVEQAMRCIHFRPTADKTPCGRGYGALLDTEFFHVAHRSVAQRGIEVRLRAGRCTALMMLTGTAAEVRHEGDVQPVTELCPGQTILLPAGLKKPVLRAGGPCHWLQITLSSEAK
jgi:mannose-6-phosphate isomerase